VFTARYALNPCIKQIRFVFKGLNKISKSNSKTILENCLGSLLITCLHFFLPCNETYLAAKGRKMVPRNFVLRVGRERRGCVNKLAVSYLIDVMSEEQL
jgi:hypothetical protein